MCFCSCIYIYSSYKSHIFKLFICFGFEHLPDTPLGFGAGWCGPPSSEIPGLLLGPIAKSPPGHCPSTGPSDFPAPPPGAGSRRRGRVDLALAPPQGSAAGLACAGCGLLHPGGGSSLRNLEERKRQRGDRCFINVRSVMYFRLMSCNK